MGSMNMMSMAMAGRAMDRFDRDGSDSLDKGEFRKMMTKMGGLGGLLSSGAAFRKADTDGDGEVDQDELQAFMEKLSGRNNKRQARKELENFLKMLGVDPSALEGKSLAELQKMLNDIMCGKKSPEDFNPPSSGGACPAGGAGGGSCPPGGGGNPAPSPSPSGGGACPPAPYCPPPQINHDAGGGNDCKTIASGNDIMSGLQASDRNGNGVDRAEFSYAMNQLNDAAAIAGSKSFLNDVEKENLFKRFDADSSGTLDQGEQIKLTNYITSGNPSNFGDNRLTVGDWNKLNNTVPN